jgi:hypothetical protein
MLPAMGHCNLGGTGPKAIGGGSNEPPREFRNADHHVANAVMKWVEQGVAPERIIATQLGADGKVVRQRPVCAYPAEARYKGTGDVNAAENFHCVTPSASIVRWTLAMLLIQSRCGNGTLGCRTAGEVGRMENWHHWPGQHRQHACPKPQGTGAQRADCKLARAIHARWVASGRLTSYQRLWSKQPRLRTWSSSRFHKPSPT